MHAALKEQIAGLERRLWLEGSEAFDKIMAPECFMVFPNLTGALLQYSSTDYPMRNRPASPFY